MKKKHYPLDLSALAYPLMKTRSAQSVFRLSALLDKPVDPDALRRSAEDTLLAYPHFKTKVVCGFFWHRLRENDAPVVVREDCRPPLKPLRKEDTNEYPFRIAYTENEIVFELFHAIGDGYAGCCFFADLLTRYVELTENIRADAPARVISAEDPFLANGKRARLRDLSIGRYGGGRVLGLGRRDNYEEAPRLLSVAADLDALKGKAKAAGATLTEYVAAAYIATVLSTQSLPLSKPLSLFIPIDLRRFFPSDSMRNFVCFERITLPKGTAELSFPDLLAKVRKQFREKITKEGMQRNVDDVVTCFRMPVVARTPLFLKSPCFRIVKKLANKVRQTAILSSLGTFTLPPEAASHVREVRFFLNINRNAPLNVAMMSYAGKCFIDVTCGLKNTDIPEKFFDFLLS